MLAAVLRDAEGQLNCLVAHRSLVADFHPQRIEEHHWIQRLQRASLPFRDFRLTASMSVLISCGVTSAP